MSVNKVILVGNLGKDPELRYTAQQLPVASFSIATNERRKDQSGNWVNQTEWHNVVVFGKVAENCNQYLKKGRQVYLEGRIQTRKWQDKEGKDRYTTEIIATSVQFLGNKGDFGGEASSSNSEDYSQQGVGNGGEVMSQLTSADSIAQASENTSVAFDDDDIPF